MDGLMKLLNEPLIHFLLIGSLLFLVYDLRATTASIPGGQSGSLTTQIVITQADIDQMHSLFTKTWQRPPSAEEKKTLLEDFARNEIYYREAVAMGLDRDDEVLKRRLRQKMEFIFEDISSWAEPTDNDLTAFLKKHQEKYLVDPQIAFRQVYVNAHKRGRSADADARQILAQLNRGADPDSVGDTTMMEPEFRLLPLWEIKRQFGDDFGSSLLQLKPGSWGGPVKSGFGLHLVLVKERKGGRLPDLKEVREAVKRDWAVDRQKEMKDAAYAKIRERYTVTVEQPKSAAVSSDKNGAQL